MSKKISKKELLELLNKILASNLRSQEKRNNIRKFQDIIWGDSNGENLYDLEPAESEIMLDLALDLDFYGVNVLRQDHEIGIKDIENDKEDLENLINDSLGKLRLLER